MRSLERQILLGLALVLALFLGGLIWASAYAVRSLSEAYVITRLEHDAEALLSAFGINPRGEPRLREGRVTPIYRQPLSGHYFVLRGGDGHLIRSRSLWDENLPIDPLPVGAVRIASLPGPDDQQLLVRIAGYEKGGQALTLLVAEDLAPMRKQIQRYQWLTLAGVGVVLLAILLLQRVILRRGFTLFDAIRQEVGRIATGEQQQIATLGPSEIRPLTTELNRLLRQVQHRLQRSRQALGNLAHALKSPLSLLLQDVDDLSLAPADRARVMARADRIAQLIDRELTRARSATQGSGKRFDPATHIPPLMDAVALPHVARNLVLETDLPYPSLLPLDYEDMLELCGNLIDNACKWAQRRVRIAIFVNGDLQLCVADDGPGVATADREALLLRGTRLDEQQPGHGLGLAIVKDLVEDYRGTLDLGRSAELGGLEVRISLPLGRDLPTA